MTNTKLDWPLQTKKGILESVEENIFTRTVIGALFTIIDESSTNEEDPPSTCNRPEIRICLWWNAM